ncbi:MAG: hypothetical protein ICV68_18760 [Pyrinomonadaceae bacterium]|nr:hypothetical protein [Pyrinomonadaceae bacterium]
MDAVVAATEVGVSQRPCGFGLGDGGSMEQVSAEGAFTILLRLRGGGLATVSVVTTAWRGRAT